MNPKIIIQNATLNDAEAMFKMGEENWQLWIGGKYKWYSKKDLQKWLTDSKSDILLVAKDGNQTIGMIVTYILQGYAYCDGLCVLDKYRGQNIGTRLLDETGKILKQREIKILSLLVNVKNNRALKLYEELDFTKTNTFLWMNKKL